MHRTKLLACTAGIVIAIAGVSAGPLTAPSAAETTKPVTTASDVYVSKAKTSDKQQAAMLTFIRG